MADTGYYYGGGQGYTGDVYSLSGGDPSAGIPDSYVKYTGDPNAAPNGLFTAPGYAPNGIDVTGLKSYDTSAYTSPFLAYLDNLGGQNGQTSKGLSQVVIQLGLDPQAVQQGLQNWSASNPSNNINWLGSPVAYLQAAAEGNPDIAGVINPYVAQNQGEFNQGQSETALATQLQHSPQTMHGGDYAMIAAGIGSVLSMGAAGGAFAGAEAAGDGLAAGETGAFDAGGASGAGLLDEPAAGAGATGAFDTGGSVGTGLETTAPTTAIDPVTGAGNVAPGGGGTTGTTGTTGNFSSNDLVSPGGPSAEASAVNSPGGALPDASVQSPDIFSDPGLQPTSEFSADALSAPPADSGAGFYGGGASAPTGGLTETGGLPAGGTYTDTGVPVPNQAGADPSLIDQIKGKIPPGVSDAWKTVQKYGPLASAAYQQFGAKKAGQTYANQLNAIGGTQSAAAQQMVQQAQAGNLPAGDQAAIDQWKTQAIAQARNYFAKAGMANSTQAKQAESDIAAKAEAMKAQQIQTMLQTGLQELNITDQNQRAAVTAEMQSDQAAAAQMNNFLNSYGSWLRATSALT